MQDFSFNRAQSLVSSIECQAPIGTEYEVNVLPSACVQPSPPGGPAYSLPWAANATVTSQPPPLEATAKTGADFLPKSRLSPYFSHRGIKNGPSSSLLGRPRASSLSRTSSGNNDNLAQVVVRRNVFSSMSDSIAFGDNNSTRDISIEEALGTSILPPPVALRRISIRKDPTTSTSPSATALALGLSNLTLTDDFELKSRYRDKGTSDGGSSSSRSSTGGRAETFEKAAAHISSPALVANTASAVESDTRNTTATTSEWRTANRVLPMLSPDGKLVGYKQNSSMMRRQMQVSMPFSDMGTATPPESPLFMNSNSGTTSSSTTHYGRINRVEKEEEEEEGCFLVASQDPFAGFPDAENQLDGYLLGPVVGRGGFSSVHKGLHVATSLPVAVKVIDKSRMRDPKDRDRVDREMRVMRQLSGHINIAQLIECAETPQYIYIIMEYCAGGSLLDYVRGKRKLSENEASLLFQQLLAALQHCHGRGVVHRDIKLENVLLDGRGGVKLIDFGLCGYYVPDKPLRCHCGSPSYAAPEIVSRKDYLAGPVDVWSAGVVLYAMLAGYLPFQARDKKSLSTKIIKATWTPPSSASPAAVDLLERMLTLDPEERICLNKIWEHFWVVQGPRWEGNGEGPNGLMRTTVDAEVVDAWVHIGGGGGSGGNGGGFTMATLLRALRLKECNAITAGYHLLCQAKISTNETSNTCYMESNNSSGSRSFDNADGDTKSSGESCTTAATSSDLNIFI